MPYTSQQISQELAVSHLGLKNLEDVFWNMPTPRLYEHAIRNREGHLARQGALVVRSAYLSGQPVNDKYIVDEAASRDKAWWGNFDHSFSEQQFEGLFNRMRRYLQGDQLYVEDCLLAADSAHEKSVRLITQEAWHCLFARSMYVRPADLGRDSNFSEADFTVIHAPHFHALPSRDGTRSEAFVILHLGLRVALIGGTAYAGEIKSTLFSIMNYLLPTADVLPLQAAANIGEDGDVALFLGQDGSGKTALVSDSERSLLADDALGWGAAQIFPFEAGCYARVKHLSAEKEAIVYQASQSFGAILENVGMDTHRRHIDFDDLSLTENTRAAYRMDNIKHPPAVSAEPKHIILLAADAFGVLPAIARLTPEQAMYYFLLGYSSRAGAHENALPEANFSPCFGAQFMARHPSEYAKMFGAKVRAGDMQCWLLNTGWSGGPCGVGERMDIGLSRTLLSAALSGKLNDIKYQTHPILGLQMPDQLDPITTWSDPADYKAAAIQLAASFKQAFAEFEEQMPPEVRAAGPR